MIALYSAINQEIITESHNYMSDFYYVIVDPVSQGCFLSDCSILADESMIFHTVRSYKEADLITQNTFVKICLIFTNKETFTEFSDNYYLL